MMFNRIEAIKDSLRSKIKQAEDVVFKELHTKDKYIEAFYIKSISDETILQDYMINPFFKAPSPEHFLAYLQSQPKVKPFAQSVLKVRPKSETIPSNALSLSLGKDGSETPYVISQFLFDLKRRLIERGLDPMAPNH